MGLKPKFSNRFDDFKKCLRLAIFGRFLLTFV